MTPIQPGREAPIWVASLYPPRKYINILMENLYNAIGIFYIEKLRVLLQCPLFVTRILGSPYLFAISNYTLSLLSLPLYTIDLLLNAITSFHLFLYFHNPLPMFLSQVFYTIYVLVIRD